MTLEDVAVIDWDEAMIQCGDDEEFLLELLGDLKNETDMQMQSMEEAIQEPTDHFFVIIVRAAHVIKGAASNLMCEQLRLTAMELETAGQNGVNLKDTKMKTKDLEIAKATTLVKEKFGFLKEAVSNYHEYVGGVCP